MNESLGLMRNGKIAWCNEGSGRVATLGRFGVADDPTATADEVRDLADRRGAPYAAFHLGPDDPEFPTGRLFLPGGREVLFFVAPDEAPVLPGAARVVIGHRLRAALDRLARIGTRHYERDVPARLRAALDRLGPLLIGGHLWRREPVAREISRGVLAERVAIVSPLDAGEARDDGRVTVSLGTRPTIGWAHPPDGGTVAFRVVLERGKAPR